MKTFIIRHGDTFIKDDVILTQKGCEQAHNTGKWLKKYFSENEIEIEKTEIFYSPLARTEQTKNLINSTMCVEQENAEERLREQEYGLFEGLSIEQQKITYPNLYEQYVKVKSEHGRFFARFPDGESPEDVSKRIDETVRKLKKISEDKNIIVISHATAIKCLLLKWFDYSTEWYQSEPIPKNCSVRLIDKDNDYGYIYEP